MNNNVSDYEEYEIAPDDAAAATAFFRDIATAAPSFETIVEKEIDFWGLIPHVVMIAVTEHANRLANSANPEHTQDVLGFLGVLNRWWGNGDDTDYVINLIGVSFFESLFPIAEYARLRALAARYPSWLAELEDAT